MRQFCNPQRGSRNAASIALCASLLLITALARPALAVPGALDPGFSGNGKLTTLMTTPGIGYSAIASSVAIQTNGRIVVAGQAGGGNSERFALARYMPNGDLDTSFSGDGKVLTPFGSSFAGATSVAIQADQKIVAAGWKVSGNNTVFALARYKINGNLDTSFSGNGKATTSIGSNSSATSVAIQSDQKIVAAGQARVGNKERFALARYQINGNIDPTFGSNGNGKVTTAMGTVSSGAASVAIQPDQMIVVAGSASTTPFNGLFALARYQTNGTLDTTSGFGSGSGKITTPFGSSVAGANSVAIQPSDGKIVAAGYSGTGSGGKFAVARYDPITGALDTTFGSNTNGKVTTSMGPYSEARSVGIQSGGEIVVAGNALQSNSSVFAIARYNSGGVLDINFDGDGKVKTLIGSSAYAASMAIQPSDGQIVVSGQASVGNHYRFALARYDD